MPTSRTQLTILDMSIRNSKPNSGYVHTEYKTQFQIMISVTHFSTTDIGVRELQLQMLIAYRCLYPECLTMTRKVKINLLDIGIRDHISSNKMQKNQLKCLLTSQQCQPADLTVQTTRPPPH